MFSTPEFEGIHLFKIDKRGQVLIIRKLPFRRRGSNESEETLCSLWCTRRIVQGLDTL